MITRKTLNFLITVLREDIERVKIAQQNIENSTTPELHMAAIEQRLDNIERALTEIQREISENNSFRFNTIENTAT
jgi:hypothetical protein